MNNFPIQNKIVQVGSEPYALPKDKMKETFEFFKKSDVSVPRLEETSLGRYFKTKNEEQLESFSCFELNDMIEFAVKESRVINLQNDIFAQYLKKHDLRFDPEELTRFERSEQQCEREAALLTTKEMSRSKVILPDESEALHSPFTYEHLIRMYIQVIDDEIQELNKIYERDLVTHRNLTMKINSEKEAMSEHADKVNEMKSVLKDLVVVKTNGRKTADPLVFLGFLKISAKQDKQEMRRLSVLECKIRRETMNLRKKIFLERHFVKVDLDLYEIKCRELEERLEQQIDEFLQIKKIFDVYSGKLSSWLVEMKTKETKFLNNVRRSVLVKKLKEKHCGFRPSVPRRVT